MTVLENSGLADNALLFMCQVQINPIHLQPFFVKMAAMQKKPAKNRSGCGEIGRHTRLRIWRREAWGFESLHPDFFNS